MFSNQFKAVVVGGVAVAAFTVLGVKEYQTQKQVTALESKPIVIEQAMPLRVSATPTATISATPTVVKVYHTQQVK